MRVISKQSLLLKTVTLTAVLAAFATPLSAQQSAPAGPLRAAPSTRATTVVTLNAPRVEGQGKQHEAPDPQPDRHPQGSDDDEPAHPVDPV